MTQQQGPVEVTGKFGTYILSKARTSRDKLVKLLRFYASREGRDYLRTLQEDEYKFVETAREGGIEKPYRVPVSTGSLEIEVRDLDPHTLDVTGEEVIDAEDG